MTLTASEARKQARESLKGKWGVVALINLIFLAISIAVSLLSSIPVLGFLIAIAGFIIDVPLAYGLIMSMMKVKRGNNVGYADFLTDGFANFGRAWALVGRLILKMIVPIILVVISVIVLIFSGTGIFFIVAIGGDITDAAVGTLILMFVALVVMIVGYVWLFIKSFTYALSNLLAIDNPNMSALECVNRSKELMDGNKGRLFCLEISFIGWALLAGILAAIPVVGIVATFAVSLILVPYMQVAIIVFYENRLGINYSAPTDENTTSNNDNSNNNNVIQEQSGSQDVKAEIVDIPNMDPHKDSDDEQ